MRAICITLIGLLTCSLPGLAHSEGAFAFGRGVNGGWSSGTAFNASTPDEARSIALQRCRAMPDGAANCKVVQSFSNRCVALALKDGHGGIVLADDLQEAEQKALEGCNQSYGPSCTIQETFCDTESATQGAQPRVQSAEQPPRPPARAQQCLERNNDVALLEAGQTYSNGNLKFYIGGWNPPAGDRFQTIF
jgi:Domain of unknown function (DUF4189)